MKVDYVVFDIKTTGLYPWFGDSVTCICARDSNEEEFQRTLNDYSADNEEQLIVEFINWLELRPWAKLITFNGLDFDIPFILTRQAQHNQKLLYVPHELFSMANLEKRLIDLQKIIEFPRLSLAATTKLYNCGEKSGNGKNAIYLAQQGKWDEIKKYCMQDVLITEKVYLTCNSLKLYLPEVKVTKL